MLLNKKTFDFIDFQFRSTSNDIENAQLDVSYTKNIPRGNIDV